MRWMVGIALAAMLTTACQIESPSLPSSWAQTSNRLRLPGELPNREQLVKAIEQAQMKSGKERPLEYGRQRLEITLDASLKVIVPAIDPKVLMRLIVPGSGRSGT